MRYDEASRLVTGLVLSNRIAASAVRKELFMPPFDEIVAMHKKGDPIEDIIQSMGTSNITEALDAAKTLNGLGEKNWIKILEETKVMYESGLELEKIGRKLSQGDAVENNKIKDVMLRMKSSNTCTKPLSEIKDEEMPFIETGWAAWDEHIGGIPEVGLVLISGHPGVGKTTFMGKLAGSFIKKHPDKKAIVYSAEMIDQEIAGRLRQINNLSTEEESRLLINDMSFTPEAVINDAALHDDVGLVLVDFADYLIAGEITESAMGHLYRTFAVGSKELHCPIVVLAQPNRSYKGGIPRPFHIRYSSMAEILAWMMIMLYNPNTDYFEDDKDEDRPLPCGWRHVNGQEYDLAYAIFWKVRGGFRKHPDDSPGAIQLLFKGNKGWSNKGKWFPLKKGR